jgi:hypothetical protein
MQNVSSHGVKKMEKGLQLQMRPKLGYKMFKHEIPLKNIHVSTVRNEYFKIKSVEKYSSEKGRKETVAMTLLKRK